MTTFGLIRRRVLQTAAVTASRLITGPLVRAVGAAGVAVSTGKMMLAWQTNLARRWLDPLQHDGGATPNNFLNAVDDVLIKNFDHLALADRFIFAEDAKRAAFRLRDTSNP